jgi:hypothetical protein
MRRKINLFMAVVLIVQPLLSCSSKKIHPLTHPQIDEYRLKNIIMLPPVAEIYQIKADESKEEVYEWGNQVKKNLQKAVKIQFQNSAYHFIQTDLSSYNSLQVNQLTTAYIKLTSLEKKLIRNFLDKNKKNRLVSIDKFVIPGDLSFLNGQGDAVLFCKMVDGFSSTGRIVKHTVIIMGLVVLVFLVICATNGAFPSSFPSSSKKVKLGSNFVSCTLVDLKTNEILWYNARNIKGDSRKYKDVKAVIQSIFSSFPIKRD